jgi:hypothetical protein
VEFLAPSAILDSYPAEVDGDILGSGADHSVEAMACVTELTYFAPAGEELVVRLDNLTPGTSYAVNLESPEDLAFYVTQGCTDGEIADGDCLLFTDAAARGEEIAAFTAPDSGQAFVVVDHFISANPIADGSFTVKAYEQECEVNADCTTDAASPFCSNLRCVPCTTSFHCTDAALPVCDNDLNVCVAGHDQCTGDDPNPPENNDDGPAGAVMLTPTDVAPSVVNAKICGLPNTGSDLLGNQDAEVDFYKFDLLADEKRGVSLTWASNADDLDLYLFDATGTALDTSFFGAISESLVVEGRDAGTYYLAVAKFDDTDPVSPAAVDYTLTVTFPECDTNFDCLTAALPVCGPALVCEGPGNLCSTDDLNEPNDGPADATPLTSATQVTGLICNTPAAERDYYSITVVDGDSLDVNLSYVDATNVDIDFAVFSADGTLHGASFWLNPEIVNLTFLPAGTYFIEVRHSGGATAVSHAYDLTATVTATAGCTTTADCAAVFSTQIYRGSCQGAAELNPGACVAIEGAGALALGGLCDSGDDCTSGLCSNLIFQSGADSSVCTIACVADTTCTGAHGPGFSCTIPFTNNKCHPDCAGDLDCGAVTNFNPPDVGQPWDYLTCNVGVCELSM